MFSKLALVNELTHTSLCMLFLNPLVTLKPPRQHQKTVPTDFTPMMPPYTDYTYYDVKYISSSLLIIHKVGLIPEIRNSCLSMLPPPLP